jgi:hypothetical protein
MIESLFKQRSTLVRLQSGPLAQHLPLIAEALHQEGYPPETIRRYVRVADGFGRWLRKNGLPVTAVDETTLARYRTSTGRRQKGPLRAAGRGLARVLALLRKQHAVGDPVRVAETAEGLSFAACARTKPGSAKAALCHPATMAECQRAAKCVLRGYHSVPPGR